MRSRPGRKIVTTAIAGAAAAGLAVAGVLASTASAAPAHPAHPARTAINYGNFAIRTVLSGQSLSHKNSKTGKSEALTKPDDITLLDGSLYVAFQNGVGPQGETAADGDKDSTIVQFEPNGTVLSQVDVTGKVDGLTADTANGDVVATVNEDLHSSLYVINGSSATHYTYSAPLVHGGGTDAISFYNGKMLVSASAPGTTGKAAPQARYPAVYSVTLNSATGVATATPYYLDGAFARVANGSSLGKGVSLTLTDPDSSEVVPNTIARFGGDFMLNSQGDQELIFDSAPSSLWVLHLPFSIDDTAFPTQWQGAIYATDNGADKVVVVDSRLFWPRSAFVAVTPCNANSAPANCPAKGFPANYLGLLNMWDGSITPVHLNGKLHPQGLVFVPSS